MPLSSSSPVPPNPPSLLPGKPAVAWARGMVWGFAGTLACVLVAGAGYVAAPEPLDRWLMAAAIAAGFLSTAVAGYNWLHMVVMERRESVAGYTTEPGGPRDCWLLDATSGQVLRPPGGKTNAVKRRAP